ALYGILLPLHAVRITTRFGVIVIAALALLAALGVSALEAALAARPGLRRAIVAALFVAVGLGFAVEPIDHQPGAARPVDAVLRAEPAEVAVVEFPTNVDDSDGDAMFRSLAHGKLVMNGISGFVPASLRALSGHLTTPGWPFPLPEAQAALRRVYPRRYLVVRLGDPVFREEGRPHWIALRGDPPPLLRFRGSFGPDDLYELAPLPERGLRIEREVSYDFLWRHPVLRAALRPLAAATDLAHPPQVTPHH